MEDFTEKFSGFLRNKEKDLYLMRRPFGKVAEGFSYYGRKGKPKTVVVVPVVRFVPVPVSRTYVHWCIVPGTTTENFNVHTQLC